MVKTKKIKNMHKHDNNTKKSTKLKTKVYTKKDFSSGDGMLTSVWGPSLWHYLHTISFNYPVNPRKSDKKYYKQQIMNLKHTLPCKYCRMNLVNNLRDVPLREKDLANRSNFSKYVFRLHEHINKMLGKKSGLKYCDVRERYEHFRSRCTIDLEMKERNIQELIKSRKTRKVKKEKGCTKPLYGKKSKCVIKIVPHDTKCETFQMDNKCKKQRLIK